MKKLAFVALFLSGCLGGDGDDRTALEFTSTCVFGDADQSCADLGFGGDFNVQPEGEAGSNDFELDCTEQENGITIICGPAISIDAALQNGNNAALSEFLAKGKAVPYAPSAF